MSTLALVAVSAVVLVGGEFRPASGASRGVTPSTTMPTTAPTSPPSTGPKLRWGGIRAERHQAVVDGHSRTWTVVLPKGELASEHLPLVIILHGRGGNGTAMRAMGFDALAARDRFVLAYPDGLEGSWNDDREGVDSLPHRERVDEARFLDEVITDSVTRYGIDRARVGMIGYSNGALLASSLSCRAEPRAVVFALVSGPAAAGAAARCQLSHPTPVMEVHSLGDPIVPYVGGTIAASDGHARGSSLSVPDWRAMWLKLNACQSWSTKPLASPGPAVTQMVAQGCRAGGEVVSDTIADATHRWHRAPDFDTTEATWSFVAAHLAAPVAAPFTTRA